jgi:DNA-directed RNA polymerase specialized sigma24 family protein
VDDANESPIPGHHVNELAGFFAAHGQWLFGHACVRTHGDRDLAADLVQDTFEAAAVAWAVLREHPGGRQRAWLRWRDHMRAAEIAAVLGIAEGTVHAQLHGARRKLVAGLERYYPFGEDSGEGAMS